MHGTKASNFGVSECDLLVVMGARFSDRVTGNTEKFAKNAKIIQLDIDPVEINKNVLITEEIIGDLKDVLKTLNKRLKQQNHAEWLEKIQGYKEKYPLKYHPNVLSGPGKRSLLRKGDSIRCGLHSIINIQNREPFLRQADLERWDMVLERRLAQRQDVRIKS